MVGSTFGDADPFGGLAPNEERALLLFEEYAERREAGEPVSFDDLLRRHPEHRDHLVALHDALLEFEALGVEVFESRTTRRVPPVRLARVAAAAAVVAVAVWGTMRFPGGDERAMPSERVLAWGMTVVGASTELVRGGAVGDGDWTSMARGIRAVRDVTAATAEASPALAARLDAFEAMIRAEGHPAVERWERAVGAAGTNAATGNPEFDLIVAAAPAEVAAVGAGAWLDRLVVPQALRLRVLDLDTDDARELPAATVHVQRVNLETGLFGPPRLLGRASDPLAVPPGDLRLTIVDEPTGRFAESRLLVLPGSVVEPRLVFLRSSPVGGEMIPLAEATIAYGAPRTLEPVMHHFERSTRVAAFRIDRREVSNAEYLEYLRAADAHPEWFADGFDSCRPLEPTGVIDGLRVFRRDAGGWAVRSEDAGRAVVGVSWAAAVRYAEWAGKRLPTDREWERAAGGAEGRRYPWGDAPVAGRVDATRVPETSSRDERGVRRPATGARTGDVSALASGATRDGVLRLADNAREWVEDLFAIEDPAHGGATLLPRDHRGFALHRCVRGASFKTVESETSRVDARTAAVPTARVDDLGFRCARSENPFAGGED